MKKNLFKLISVILLIALVLFINYDIIKINELKKNTKKEIKNTKEIKTESKKVLYAYFVPKISEDDFNKYYEKKEEDISYNDIRKYSDVNIADDYIYYSNINKNEIAETEKEVIMEDSEKETNESKEDNISKAYVKETELSNNKYETKEEKSSANEEITGKDNDNIEKENDDKVIAKDETLTNKELPNTVPKEEIIKKNGFIEECGSKYYYENDVKITGIKNIDGINHYFTSNGVYLGTNNIKVIDVSAHQGKINWDLVKNSNMIYGVILRVGYYNTMDTTFLYNLNELKRLNIPYGIYLYSYTTTISGAKKEADFVSKTIKEYNVEPTLGIFYDLEGWNTKNASSDVITKNMYDKIVSTFVSNVKATVEDKYKVGVYSGRWYAMNRLGAFAKSYVNWVAEYNRTCKYDGNYFMWQYTSKGKVPGINGNVDISYIL